MKKTYYVWYDIEDAKDKLKGVAFRQTDYNREDAVESAAGYFYDNCDGREWMMSGCTLYSMCEDENDIYAHEISIDFNPSFYASLGETIAMLMAK